MIKHNSNKQGILYLMGIQWNWIKQRPHFIAEGLAEKYDLVTLSKKSLTQKGDGNETPVRVVYPIRLIPERNSLIKKINTIIYKRYVDYYLCRCKFIWFCAPNEISEYVLEKCTDAHVVIYDCMDDMLAFPSKDEDLNVLFTREESVVKRANVIFCSANHLREKISERYNIHKEITVLNNALIIEEENTTSRDELFRLKPEFVKSTAFKISYIGTVADWLDFGLVEKILLAIPEAEVHLWGPCSQRLKNEHKLKGVFFHGPVDHKYVKSIMDSSNALIMPFEVNELIKSVNPVKLYEYIYSGVPCLAPLYGESQPFGEYCYLYKDYDDCIDELKKIFNGIPTTRKTKEECESFAKANTWSQRMKVILNVMKGL